MIAQRSSRQLPMGTELGELFDNIHMMYQVCALEYPESFNLAKCKASLRNRLYDIRSSSTAKRLEERIKKIKNREGFVYTFRDTFKTSAKSSIGE